MFSSTQAFLNKAFLPETIRDNECPVCSTKLTKQLTPLNTSDLLIFKVNRFATAKGGAGELVYFYKRARL